MKKYLALALALVMALSLVACGGAASSGAASTPASTPDSTAASAPAAEGAVKTGMGIAASGAVKKEASADEKGSVQSNSTVAVVLVDAEGKIVDCKIDVAQTSTTYGTDGSVQDASEVDVRSKFEKGTDYGMLPASAIGKEWDEQAVAFAEYVIGKTAADVTGIAQVEKDGHNVASDADLAAICSMDITDMKAAVAAAVANATDMGAQAGDVLGLGVVTGVSASAADADAAGKIQHDSTFAATTKNAEGAITSNFVNVTQTKYTVSAEGVAECTTPTVTPKYELGADYGMLKASAIGKEWFEQADAYNAYVTGKTAAELAGIELVEKDGHMVAANEADLYAGCSMDITDMQAAVAKACA